MSGAPIQLAARPVVLAGYEGSGPDHWQTLWAERMADAIVVEHDDWIAVDRERWVAEAREQLPAGEPLMLIGHSIGSLIAAELLADPGELTIVGGWLVAIPDPHGAQFPATAHGFRSLLGLPAPEHRNRLASHAPLVGIVASEDDPYASVAWSELQAEAWGAGFELLPGAGHINADSGYGPWQAGIELCEALTRVASSWQERRIASDS
jgi:predicted alpha/beta hydrolase family esterase